MKNRIENKGETPICPTGWIIRNASRKPVLVLLILALLVGAFYLFGLL